MSIGMALGPALGVFLLGKIDFSGVFLVCTGLAIASVVAAFFVRVPAFQKKKATFTLSGMFEKRVLGIAFMFFTFGIAYGSIMIFAIIHGKNLGVANSGLFFMVIAIITAVMRPIIGKHLDKNGLGNIMGVGFLLLMAGMLVMSFANGAQMYFTAAFLLGMGVGIVMPLLAAMAMNVVLPNRRGTANATAFGAFDAGIGLGSIALGKIAGIFTISTMYLFSFSILIIPLVFYYVYEKRNYTRLAAEMDEK
jgi:MFS family permease